MRPTLASRRPSARDSGASTPGSRASTTAGRWPSSSRIPNRTRSSAAPRAVPPSRGCSSHRLCLPPRWTTYQADSKAPAPPVLPPGTGQPIGPADLAPLFPMELIKQEVSRRRWIEIPDEVRDILKLWRPSPLFRARRLEKLLGTPARIYYKYEGVSPAGSHKPNTAVAQAYYNKKEKGNRLVTEMGARPWGSALALAR